jgi:hypothetical protein
MIYFEFLDKNKSILENTQQVDMNHKRKIKTKITFGFCNQNKYLLFFFRCTLILTHTHLKYTYHL